MGWHDDPQSPTWPTVKKSRERLVPRRASPGIKAIVQARRPSNLGTTAMTATPATTPAVSGS